LLETIDSEKLNWIRHQGLTTDESFLEFYTMFYRNDEVDRSYNQLIDLRSATSSNRSPQALQQLAEMTKQSRIGDESTPKIAVVAPERLTFGLARMYDAYSDLISWKFVIFRHISAAVAWLHLSETLSQRIETTGAEPNAEQTS
jgi:hypothetical protein